MGGPRQHGEYQVAVSDPFEVIAERTHREQDTPTSRAKAPARPPVTAFDQVLALQRTVGNAAVTRMLARDEAPRVPVEKGILLFQLRLEPGQSQPAAPE